MERKITYFDFTTKDNKGDALCMLLTPEAAWDIKMQMEEYVYESKYKGKNEDHNPFMIAVSGRVCTEQELNDANDAAGEVEQLRVQAMEDNS